MKKTVFYHAGCPVCLSAERELLNLMDASGIEIIHLGEEKSKVDAAENSGVKSVPALVTPTGNVLHINFGAALSDLK